MAHRHLRHFTVCEIKRLRRAAAELTRRWTSPRTVWFRRYFRESMLEALDAAARKGKHGGRPPVINNDMLHTVLRRRANGESVEQISPT
ncbi:hypothetical protein [Streptomyces violarus]|uniref:hypothetical protein n=1 Tax=Streptomyces violarus TaxID=67380 RepID=UPI0021BF0260|nr:hypothetical protein [Streptomyces violarus]MCT9142995.1 hypothetical protein [Streptomyces violarus]